MFHKLLLTPTTTLSDSASCPLYAQEAEAGKFRKLSKVPQLTSGKARL